MGRLFTAASSQRLTSATTPLSTFGFTMACWVKASAIAFKAAMSLNNTSTNARYVMFIGNNATRVVQLANATQSLNSSATWSDDTWFHAAVKITGTGANQAATYVNGSGNTGTLNSAQTGLDSIGIGARFSTTWGLFMNGTIAVPCFWNAGLSDDEVAQLAAGYHPSLVRPDAIVAGWDLDQGASPEPDHWGGHNLSLTGSPTLADDPPLIYPPGVISIAQASAPATGSGPLHRSRLVQSNLLAGRLL